MLEKLKILAYSDENLKKKIGEYTVQINPEKYGQSFSTEFVKRTNLNSSGTTTKYVSQKPQTLSLELYLDGTGAVRKSAQDTTVISVAAEIKKLNDVVYKYNGEIHSPNYLQILWGKLDFDCRITGMDVEYLLFAPTGVPLRAKLSPKFEQYISPEKLALQSRSSSPDLTHYRTVAAGDTLPLMCYRIYQDPKYYLEVARVNGLFDFRNLEPGRRIFFPPLGD
jgi:hypothetical protein